MLLLLLLSTSRRFRLELGRSHVLQFGFDGVRPNVPRFGYGSRARLRPLHGGQSERRPHVRPTTRDYRSGIGKKHQGDGGRQVWSVRAQRRRRISVGFPTTTTPIRRTVSGKLGFRLMEHTLRRRDFSVSWKRRKHYTRFLLFICTAKISFFNNFFT